MPRGARWYAKSITNHARAYQAGLAHFMPFSYTVLVLVVIGAALIWGATLDSQGRIVVARAGKAGTPQFQPSLKVFGMYCSLPARAYGVLGGKPGVFRPASIHEYCLMAGKSSPGNFGLLQQYLPTANSCTAPKQHDHSMTSSTSARKLGGKAKFIAFAVLRLISSSNLVGRSTGISAGFAPWKILSIIPAARRNCSVALTE